MAIQLSGHSSKLGTQAWKLSVSLFLTLFTFLAIVPL